jgi:hypothetical protein
MRFERAKIEVCSGFRVNSKLGMRDSKLGYARLAFGAFEHTARTCSSLMWPVTVKSAQ